MSGGWRRQRKNAAPSPWSSGEGGREEGKGSEQLPGFSLVQPTTHHTGEPMTHDAAGL